MKIVQRAAKRIVAAVTADSELKLILIYLELLAFLSNSSDSWRLLCG